MRTLFVGLGRTDTVRPRFVPSVATQRLTTRCTPDRILKGPDARQPLCRTGREAPGLTAIVRGGRPRLIYVAAKACTGKTAFAGQGGRDLGCAVVELDRRVEDAVIEAGRRRSRRSTRALGSVQFEQPGP
jgi:hypothetical protein